MVTDLAALTIGLTTIGLAYALSLVGATILQLSMSIFGLFGGPVLGVFCLGMFTPFANRHGALVGLLVGTLFNLYLGFGTTLSGARAVQHTLD
jgi:sodium-dependent multivitamin transporter 6